ncbi:uncharacterized protein LOC124112752 [Haliotis rufescens]|uniref:uncharacterized protein LOC124112752 n=1 Tax=Haliotis rufescens TaxID=6454 RepID=UPI00201EF8E6|nr:uncharacterized protein LOC124112752 [Haliotis rufescens]
MPVVRLLSKSECEGFDPEVAECFAPTEPIEFHDSAPKFATIKPTPIRPEPPFQWDCVKEDKQAKEHELHVQLMAVLAEVNTLRADLRDAGLRSQSLDLKNLHLQMQVRQLWDQKVSLRKQVHRLVKEVDMVKGQRGHGGEGEGFVHNDRNTFMSLEKDNVSARHLSDLALSDLSSTADVSPTTNNSSELCNEGHHAVKSLSVFGRIRKLFRRRKS